MSSEIGAVEVEPNGGVKYVIPPEAVEGFKEGWKSGGEHMDKMVTKLSKPAGYTARVGAGIYVAYLGHRALRRMSTKYSKATDWVGSQVKRVASKLANLDFHTATPAEKVAMAGSGSFTTISGESHNVNLV